MSAPVVENIDTEVTAREPERPKKSTNKNSIVLLNQVTKLSEDSGMVEIFEKRIKDAV